MIMMKPLSSAETLKMKAEDVRKAYTALAKEYKKILNSDYIYCPYCGQWKSAAANYYKSSQTIDGYNHYGCKECILEQATDKNKNGDYVDNKDKAKAVLMKLDFPYIENLYNQLLGELDRNGIVDRRGGTMVFPAYVTMVRSLPQYNQLTWKDSKFEDSDERIDLLPTQSVRKNIIRLFGDGLTTSDYLYLQDQYDDWKARTQIDTKSQETYIVNICNLQLQIHNAQKAGRDTGKLLDTLNKLMDAARLQPKQNLGSSEDNTLSLGQLIQKWEDEYQKPIPDPEPDQKDVEGIGHAINVWFKGHLCRMFGFDNGYSKEYDDEMRKYEVRKTSPEEMGRSEGIFESLFGQLGESDES